MLWRGTGYWSESFKSPVLRYLLRPIISNIKKNEQKFCTIMTAFSLGYKNLVLKIMNIKRIEWRPSENLIVRDRSRSRRTNWSQGSPLRVVIGLLCRFCLGLWLPVVFTRSQTAEPWPEAEMDHDVWRLWLRLQLFVARLAYDFVTHSLDDCVTSQKNKEF